MAAALATSSALSSGVHDFHIAPNSVAVISGSPDVSSERKALRTCPMIISLDQRKKRRLLLNSLGFHYMRCKSCELDIVKSLSEKHGLYSAHLLQVIEVNGAIGFDNVRIYFL